MKPHPLVITLLTQVEDVIPRWKIVPTKQDVIDAAFKDPVKREKVSQSVSHRRLPCFPGGKMVLSGSKERSYDAPACHAMQIRRNQLIYQDKPRLKTALEMLRTSMYIEDSLSQVRTPVLREQSKPVRRRRRRTLVLNVWAQVTLPFFVLHGEADTVTDPEVSRALYERSASADKTIKLYPGMWHGLTAGEPDENVEAIFSDIVSWLNQRSRSWAVEERHMTRKLAPAPAKSIEGHGTVDGKVHTQQGRPRRRQGFLCGLAGRTHHHAEM